MENGYEDRFVTFTARCLKVCEALPANRQGSIHIQDQLFRSSTSMTANYAEAQEAESRKDFIHKLKVAMKELSETRIWLKIAIQGEYIAEKKLKPLVDEAAELSRMLSAAVITARKNEHSSK